MKSNLVNHLHNKEALKEVLWEIKRKEVIGIKHRTEGIHANTKRTSQKKNDDALAKIKAKDCRAKQCCLVFSESPPFARVQGLNLPWMK